MWQLITASYHELFSPYTISPTLIHSFSQIARVAHDQRVNERSGHLKSECEKELLEPIRSDFLRTEVEYNGSDELTKEDVGEKDLISSNMLWVRDAKKMGAGMDLLLSLLRGVRFHPSIANELMPLLQNKAFVLLFGSILMRIDAMQV